MKRRNIIFIVLSTLCLFSICTTVYAKKENWIDKNYKFAEIHSVRINDVEYLGNLHLESELCEQIQVIGKKFENKIKRLIFDETSENVADVKIVTTIVNWDNISKYIPEKIYYEGWERKRVRDKEGTWKTVTGGHKTSNFPFPGGIPKRKPAHYEYTSMIEVNFEIYDVKTGNLIMKRNDKRDRHGKDEQINMFERMCKSFFKDFAKKLKG